MSRFGICFQSASRQVFICTGILYIIFGVVGKFSAVFITIPYPVLGGAALVMFSNFLGVVLSNLQVRDSLHVASLDVILSICSHAA